MKKKHVYIGLAATVLALIIGARLYLNVWMLDYVNRVLANIEGYEGSVEDIDIDLYRGAYRIHQLSLRKKNGHIPTPFIDIEQADLSVQWGGLLHGRIVSDVDLLRPVINFATAGKARQTGAGVDWTKPIKDLMPIDINLVTLHDGKLTYQDFSSKPKVNIYMHQMNGELRNLRNVEDAGQGLPSSLDVAGNSIGGGRLAIKGKLNILKPTPDMDIDARLENVNMPALSNYSNAYAAIDIKAGKLSVYSELVIKDNRVSGYVKPIASHVELIDLRKADNPLQAAWQLLVATVVDIFTNRKHDQFATKIPLEGKLDNIDTDSWSAVAGIVRNAFVKAFSKGIDSDVKYNVAPK